MSKLAGSWLGMDKQDEDAECRLTGNTGTRPNCDECDECEFNSRHPGACHFLWADGHVGAVNSSIDQAVYQRMGTRSDH
jgi:prepilin-type processing-associated H-X9-DG protein